MRLRYMELRNYRKFRDARIEFPDGVVAIIGPNGAGKTTVLEAVTWALFGNEGSVVRDGKEGVISYGASPGDECSVVLEFDLGEDSYRLVRAMKGKGLKVDASLEVNGRLLATGDTVVTNAIVARLGMDHRAFFASVFARQKDLNALANLRPAERKALVLRMLGVDSLDDVIKEVERDAKEVRGQAEQLSGLLRDAQGRDRLGLLREEERSAREALEAVRESRAKLLAERQAAGGRTGTAKALWEGEEERYRKDTMLERRMTGLRAGLQARRSQLARLEGEVRELEGLRASLPELERREGEYQQARAEGERHAALRESYLQRRRGQEELEAREKELRALDEERERTAKALAAMPDVEASLATVEASLREVRELASTVSAQDRLAGAEADRLRLQLAEAKRRAEEVRALGEDSNCPVCLRRMGQQYIELLRRYEEEQRTLEKGIAHQEEVRKGLLEQRARVEQRREALEARRDRLLGQARERASLEERARAIERSYVQVTEGIRELRRRLEAIGEVAYDPAAHEEAKRKAAELEGDHLSLSRAQVKLERLPCALREREEAMATIALEEEELAKAVQERAALAFDAEALASRRREYEEARSAEETLVQAIIRADGEERRLASELDSLRQRAEELEGMRARHTELRAEQEMLNRLSQVMRGFKESIISRIVPTLSETSSDLLSQLTEGKYGGMRLDDNYQMWLYDQGEEHRLERFSGGEVDLANLCLRLAISRMITERSGSQINLLVLDEIFGSQDQTRKRSILETLGQLQRQFRQILLITHIDDVKDSVGAVLRVQEREDGSSTVVLED